MGQRANMVVLRDGAWTLYYDHWAANRLDDELFMGPETALAFIVQRDPCPPDEWLDDVWCEGAALMDFDRRRLLFFGGENIRFEIDRRHVHLELMRENWPGWTVEWAHGGLGQIVTELGVSTDGIVNAWEMPERAFSRGRRAEEMDGILLTTVLGAVQRAQAVEGGPRSLMLGPDAVAPFARGPAVPRLRWGKHMPVAGIHADFDTRTLSFWWCDPEYAMDARVRPYWPGWSVRWLLDDYAAHLGLTQVEIRLPIPDRARLREDQLAILGRSSRFNGRNPALDIIGKVEGTVELNPATFESRASAGDPEARERRVAEMRERPTGALATLRRWLGL